MRQLTKHPAFKNKEILVVVAHPDDECLYFFGGLKALSEMANITVLSATYTRTSHRAKELRAACQFLGIQCDFLEIPDLGFNTLLSGLEAKFSHYITKRNFDVIITHPPHGGEKPHPHHLQVFLTSLLFCLENRFRFAFFSECQSSLCKHLTNEVLLKLRTLPLILLYSFKTIRILKWKYKIQWFQSLGKSLFRAATHGTFKGLFFRRFEIESSLVEKRKALRNYASQKSVLKSYRTTSSDQEYLFYLKSFDKAPAEPLVPYHEHQTFMRPWVG